MPAGPPAYGPPGYGVPAGQQVKVPAGPRSPVPGLTIAALLIVVGVLALITRFSGWDVPPRGFVGAALLVVGLGLVTAAFTGGRTARGGLIALGIVLSAGPHRRVDAALERRARRGRRPHLPAGHRRRRARRLPRRLRRHDGRPVRLDRPTSDEPVTTSIDHGVGDLEVILPRSADVRLEVEQGVGDLRVFDQGAATDGFFPGRGSRPWTDDGQAEFVVTIHSGLGDVEVSRG